MRRARIGASEDSLPPKTQEFSVNMSKPNSVVSATGVSPSIPVDEHDATHHDVDAPEMTKVKRRKRKSRRKRGIDSSADGRFGDDVGDGDADSKRTREYDDSETVPVFSLKQKSDELPQIMPKLIGFSKKPDTPGDSDSEEEEEKKEEKEEELRHPDKQLKTRESSLETAQFLTKLKTASGTVTARSGELPPMETCADEEAEAEFNMTLHQCARDGEESITAALLEKLGKHRRKGVNALDEDDLTPLHYAARYNHLGVVKLLVKAGANVNAQGDENITPLHLAAKYKKASRLRKELFTDHPEKGRGPNGLTRRLTPTDDKDTKVESVVTFLIRKGANPNAEDEYKQRPLHFAAMKGNIAAARDLLSFKDRIEVDSKDIQEITPLHTSAIRNQLKIARMLIAAGANLLSSDTEKCTPLHHAAAEGNVDFVQMLLSEGARTRGLSIVHEMVTAVDIDSGTPLHYSVDSGHFDVSKLLIEQQSDVNHLRKYSTPPLQMAAQAGDLDLVRLLVNNGASVDAINDEQTAALQRAASLNHVEVVRFLLDNGAQVNRRDKDHYTALLLATTYGKVQAVELLLKRGADYTAVDKYDKTCIFMAAEENKLDVLEKLLSYRQVQHLINDADIHDTTPLHIAAQQGFLDIVKCLLKNKAYLIAMNEEERTPLHLAAKYGRTNIVRELIRHEKTIGKFILNDEDEVSNTALHLAAQYGHSNMVKNLLNLGADVSARNFYSWTPLDLAASNGWVKTCQVLLEEDAPVDPKDKNMTTPLHLASSSGHAQVVELLLSWDANVTLQDVEGRNCLDRAIEFHRRDVAFVIVNSDVWKDALRSSKYEPDRGCIDTPMRKLIRKMPEVAERVFDRCMKEDQNPESWEYKISFDYEFIDDHYCSWIQREPVNDKVPLCSRLAHKWREPKEDDTPVDVMASTSNIDEEEEEDDEKIDIDEKNTISDDTQPYSMDDVLVKRNHPLTIMIESEREDLLAHPLVTSLIQHKWNTTGSYFYYISLGFYCLFLAFITAYMVKSTPPNQFGEKGAWIENNNCTDVHVDQPVAARVGTVGIFVIATLMLLKEIAQFYQARLNYLEWNNLIEWLVYSSSLLLVVSFNGCQASTGYRYDWQWNLGALSVFLAWVNLVLIIQKFPLLGIYVVMVTDVLRTFLQFFVVFFLFIVAFALAFYVLFQDNTPYQTVGDSLLKSSVMMIGEFDFDNIFNDPDNPMAYPTASYIIFVIFLVVMSILIMNLLVGLAVDDIKAIQEQAALKRMAMQVELVLSVEQILPDIIRKRAYRKRQEIWPNQLAMKPLFRFVKNPVYKFFKTNASLSPMAIQRALNPELDEIEKVQEAQDKLQKDVDKLKCVVNDVKRLESILLAIVEHHGIDWQEQDNQGIDSDDILDEE